MTRPRMVEADATQPHRKLPIPNVGHGMKVPSLLVARFGVSNFGEDVRVVVVGVSVKAASYMSGLRMSDLAMIPSGCGVQWRTVPPTTVVVDVALTVGPC